MKLGATITSERGQPVTKTGNERIHIDVVNEKRQPIITISIDEGIVYAIKGKVFQMTVRNWVTGKEEKTIIKQG